MALTCNIIQEAASITFGLLEAEGFRCCLVGSCACYAHGASRVPNDVDILILQSDVSSDDVKTLVASKDVRFSLARPAHKPLATYWVLWYTPVVEAESPTTDPLPCRPRCRIDIFFPGPTIKLPYIPPERLVLLPLPIMPFLPTLFHKVLAWIAHGQAGREDKQVNDVDAIDELLWSVVGDNYIAAQVDPSYLPDWFMKDTNDACVVYAAAHPRYASIWKRLGLLQNVVLSMELCSTTMLSDSEVIP